MTDHKRRAIIGGSAFEEEIGYARAVVDGDRVHVSGTTGFDYASMTISDDVVEQAEQCLRNIGAALTEAGCTFEDVVRVRYLLPAREDFEPCRPVLRKTFGQVRPAATMMVCGLSDPRMRIEIEVDARRGPVGDRLRIEQVSGTAMLEQWRYVHNVIVPPAAMSPADAEERLTRNRLDNAYLGDTLVGCSTVRPPSGDGGTATVIARVLPAFRGRGIGTALYENALTHARVLGAEAVETCVLAANADGLRFAEAHGFTEIERYVLDGESDEWVDLRLAP
ncbi:GNAT family N-acetyltransferase [Streptomyces sp. XM83C]|jgi:enamine deaminase RidA (YjgF/YER057c/UK114 family)|uniref:GNAT family N-acetyltransferase n=1 Tax=Streptomyces thermocoprophilus TaxID=78356 RepID=A0ABV5VCT7_9ACTN|nr:GNAT family N-acetyltransferase [Streptomyces sp. XM83C]MCK1820654.1 GNAT family N-acetyltransferase [Streptomyces sp. XM83C]